MQYHRKLNFSIKAKIAAAYCCSHYKKFPLGGSSLVKKNCRSNVMFDKFLLIYLLVSVVFNPLTHVQCARHFELPVNSALSQTTSTSNNIDAGASVYDQSENSYEDDEGEDSDEVSNYYASSTDIRREYEKQFNKFSKNTSVKSEEKNFPVTIPSSREKSDGSCSSTMCVARKNIEEASTESIRKHILMKLGMEIEPNRTNYPKLTEEFRELLCKKINISPENCLGRKKTNVEYQSDAPVVS